MIKFKLISAAVALTLSSGAFAAVANCCADMACCKDGADCCDKAKGAKAKADCCDKAGKAKHADHAGHAMPTMK